MKPLSPLESKAIDGFSGDKRPSVFPAKTQKSDECDATGHACAPCDVRQAVEGAAEAVFGADREVRWVGVARALKGAGRDFLKELARGHVAVPREPDGPPVTITAEPFACPFSMPRWQFDQMVAMEDERTRPRLVDWQGRELDPAGCLGGIPVFVHTAGVEVACVEVAP